MERGRESIAPVPIPNRRGTNVLCGTTGAGEDGVCHQGRSPPPLVRTGNGGRGQLFQEEIPFLGHIVSAAGIGADPAKCQQGQDWPVPRDLHGMGGRR